MSAAAAEGLLFPAPEWPTLPVEGGGRVPVARSFCVGRNYEAHAVEMGTQVDREAPFWFTKSPHTVVESGATVPYPPGTADYHHEIELVAVLGQGGFRVRTEDAAGLVFGYACGLDITRRDLQLAARAKGRPWDIGKDFEESAVIGPLRPGDAIMTGTPAGVGPVRPGDRLEGEVEGVGRVALAVGSPAG
jgi:fumarylpyruvate hydrolase